MLKGRHPGRLNTVLNALCIDLDLSLDSTGVQIPSGAATLPPGHGESPSSFLDRLDRSTIVPSVATYASLLQQCIKWSLLEQGKCVHRHILGTCAGLPDRILLNLLVRMYGKCGTVEEARRQFDLVHQKNMFTFSIMLTVYAQKGHYREALQLVHFMDLEGMPARATTLISALRACTFLGDLSSGRAFHSRLVAAGLDRDQVAMTCALNMYAECGSLAEAEQVFRNMAEKDVVAWNAMVTAYARHGQYQNAIETFKQANVELDAVAFTSILTVCCDAGDVEEGRRIHQRLLSLGIEAGTVSIALVNLYSKCGCVDEARAVFERSRADDLVSWNVMISAYAQHGQGQEAMKLYRRMLWLSLRPDEFTFSSLLSTCCFTGILADGELIYSHAIESGYEEQLCASLVNMYSKCDSLEKAMLVFERSMHRNLLAWTSIITAHSQRGKNQEAVRMFRSMVMQGQKLDGLGYTCVLDACGELKDLRCVQMIYDHVYDCSSFIEDSAFDSALIFAFGKCGELGKAKAIFHGLRHKRHPTTTACWNSMLGSYLRSECFNDVLLLYRAMSLEGIKADKVTFVLLADALCSIQCSGSMVVLLMSSIYESGWASNSMVGTGLVTMLCNHGEVAMATKAFDQIDHKDVVAWNALIGGYTQAGLSSGLCHREMLHQGIKPDRVTFTKLFEASSSLPEVRKLHAQLDEYSCQHHCLSTALLEAYGRCGSLELAKAAFRRIADKDVVCWNTMLCVCAGHGHGMEALELLMEMSLEGVQANEHTFVGVLVACSHAGLEQKARGYVESMVVDYGVLPEAHHYGSMVDLLGRAAKMNEAEELVKGMPPVHCSMGWFTLAGACNFLMDAETGERAVAHVFST